jgi:hypothetical protein
MTTTSTLASATRSQPGAVRPSRPLWRAGVSPAVGAAAVNLAVFAIARAAGAPLLVRFSARRAAWSITAADVIVATLVALGLGTAGAALWLRRHRRGALLAQVTGALVALASRSIPLSVHARSGTKATPASMDLIAGAAFITARRSQATSGGDLTHRAGHGKAA